MSRDYYGYREFVRSSPSATSSSGTRHSPHRGRGTGRINNGFNNTDSRSSSVPFSSSSRYNNDDNGREQTFYDEFRPRPGESRPRSVDIRPKLPVQNRIRSPYVAPSDVDTRFVKSSPPPVEDDETDYRAMLEELNPSSTFLVELPFSGNGNLFQVRTTISNEVFYGRAETEEEAVAKCCKKATRFILQRDLNSNMVEKELIVPSSSRQRRPKQSSCNNSRIESKQKLPMGRGDSSETRPLTSGPRSALERRSDREKELRGGTLGSVLDRLDARNRGYSSNDTFQAGQKNKRERQECPRRDGGGKMDHERGNFTRGVPRATSPDPSSFSVEDKSSRDFDLNDDSTSSMNDGSVDWKYKQIPIKNAVMMLNEMFPPPSAPQYKVTSQTGPPNNPTFSMVCCIQDQTFLGEGKSKKEAKLACSQKAIEAICGHKMTETRAIPEKSNPRANCDLDDWMELEGKNPVSILNELYPGIQYQLVSTSGPSHAPLFVIKASLNEMSFEGSGKSKKDAKLNASKALLVHLHKVGFDPMTGVMMSTQQDNREVAEGHSLADRIGQLVTTKYQALFGTTTYSKRRVMAGVVMTRNWGGDVEVDLDDEANAEVICVSSGTKCINGEQLSLEGCVINDSHAEIVTRRCMLAFFYKQLIKLAQDEESIFRHASDGFIELKKGIEFHLFITTSPCGDARIFSLHESPSTISMTSSSNAIASFQIHNSPSTLVKSQSAVALPTCGDAPLQTCSLVQIDFCKSEPDIAFSPSGDESGIETDQTASPDKMLNDVSKEDENLECVESEIGLIADADDETGCSGGVETKTDLELNNNNTVPAEQQKDKRQADSSKGMLRSKIECGMGTVPINPKLTIQTWDGVLSGDRLLTMACSDKILRWNVIGVQGALLTLLIRPIYLKSITVGSKFHPGHMKRALYERISEHVTNLPAHYRLNAPQLYATTSPETRQATKAHDYSVNWIIDQGQPEIVNGSTGKTINDSTSRLSKRSLFEEFLAVSGRLQKSHLLTSPARYSEVKQLAVDYQTAKNQVGAALVTAGCGHWVEKPVEQDQFSL